MKREDVELVLLVLLILAVICLSQQTIVDDQEQALIEVVNEELE